VGYSPRVYTSPTLVATPFPRSLGSRVWQWEYNQVQKIGKKWSLIWNN